MVLVVVEVILNLVAITSLASTVKNKGFGPWNFRSENVVYSEATVIKPDLKNQLRETVAKLSNGGWFPVGPVNTFDEKLPFAITIAEKKLAVWNNPLDKSNELNGGWSVMLDACPHRLAPLSQGRVDVKSGCIECPYHGWQFDSGGKCTAIPQLASDELNSIENPKSKASSLPTYLLAGILWAFVPLPEGPASYFPHLPDDLVPETAIPLDNLVIRDFYYSFDFLLENFFDIAHIPFAHHTLQSLRTDGTPLNATLLTDISNSTHLEVSFGDYVRGKKREGIMSFSPPSIYTLRMRYTPTLPFKAALALYVMPIEPGKSRALIGGRVPLKGILFKLIFRPWLLHIFSNRFVDSDLWVHDQEIAARRLESSSRSEEESPDLAEDSSSVGTSKPRLRSLRPLMPKYALIAKKGDVGVTAWRNWWTKSGMAASSVFGPTFNAPSVPHTQQSDRYEGHVKYCKICQDALKTATKINKWSILLALLPMAVTSSRWLRVLGVLLFAATHTISGKIIDGLLGGVRGAKLTAAQFAPDDK